MFLHFLFKIKREFFNTFGETRISPYSWIIESGGHKENFQQQSASRDLCIFHEVLHTHVTCSRVTNRNSIPVNFEDAASLQRTGKFKDRSSADFYFFTDTCEK